MKFISFFKEGAVVKSAIIELKGKGFSVEDLSEFNLDQDACMLRHYVQLLKHAEKEHACVTALKEQDISLKAAELPKAKGKELQQLLSFELEKHHVFLEKSFTVASVSSKSEGTLQQVSFFSCSQKSLLAHKQQYQDLSIVSDCITTVSVALWRFCHRHVPLDSYMIFDVSANYFRIAYVNKARLEKSWEISLETYSLLSKEFFQECDKALFRALQTHQDNQLNVVFVNSGTIESEVVDFIQKQYELSVQVFCWGDLISEKERLFAIPIGMSLDAAAEDDNSINFALQSPSTTSLIFLCKNAVKRLFAVSLALTSCLLCFSSIYFHKKSRDLDKRIVFLYSELTGRSKQPELLASSDSLNEKIELIEKKLRQLKKHKIRSPGFTVSSMIKDLEYGLKKSNLQGDIIDLSYDMLSYPTQENIKTPYEAKVLITLKTTGDIELLKRHLPQNWNQISLQQRQIGYELSFTLKEKH